MLKKLGIVIGTDTKAGKVFEMLYPNFMDVKYDSPSEYISKYWEKYKQEVSPNSNLNGKVFEYILATLCIRENILPLYLSAKVAFVPNVIYDLMFYTAEKGPVCWSVKTSLRERYKQADLESIALKYVHRKALSYLITLDAREAKSVQEKIKTGDVIGLDNVIVATSDDFNYLINDMKSLKFEQPPTVKVIESSQVITMDRVNLILNNDAIIKN